MKPEELKAMQEEGRRTAEKFDVMNTSAVMGRVYEAADARRTAVAEPAARIRYLPSQNGSMRKAQ